MQEFVHRLEVRFRDCDPMGHANNAVYFTYLEQTRFAHWRSLWGFVPRSAGDAVSSSKGETPQLAPGRPGVILAHAECDFERPARCGDTLEIRLRVVSLGRTSFRYEYEIVDEQQRTVARAKTVQVMYDYKAERPVPIPEDIREMLSRAPAGRQG
jgi:acyl-CoA thioester hydrolase